MTNGFSETILKEVALAIKRGDIPAEVSNEWLWAGMLIRSEEEAKRSRKLDHLSVTVGVIAGTLVIYGGVLFIFAESLLKHLEGG